MAVSRQVSSTMQVLKKQISLDVDFYFSYILSDSKFWLDGDDKNQPIKVIALVGLWPANNTFGFWGLWLDVLCILFASMVHLKS